MRKAILSIAKKHYLKKDWYTGWSTDTDWQKCIFDAVRELYGTSVSGTYTQITYTLLEAANLKITEEDNIKLYKEPSSVCFKVIDKYYKPNFISALEIE